MDKRNSPAMASVIVALTLLLLAATAGVAGGPKFEIEIWCPTDVDVILNNVIDTFDLMMVSDAFGRCETTPCVGDVNGNGFVGVLDLAYTMSYLGPCPRDGDMDGDGDVDGEDKCILETHVRQDRELNYCLVDVDDNGWVDRYDELAVSVSLTDDKDAEPFRADVDGDGSIDVTDLVVVRDALGRDCRGDLDRDGQINADDLRMLKALDCVETPECVCL